MTTEQKTTTLEWHNDVTNRFITRTLPFIYSWDADVACKALEQGAIICIGKQGDLVFTSSYTHRSMDMARAGETIVWPCGKILTLVAMADD